MEIKSLFCYLNLHHKKKVLESLNTPLSSGAHAIMFWPNLRWEAGKKHEKYNILSHYFWSKLSEMLSKYTCPNNSLFISVAVHFSIQIESWIIHKLPGTFLNLDQFKWPCLNLPRFKPTIRDKNNWYISVSFMFKHLLVTVTLLQNYFLLKYS